MPISALQGENLDDLSARSIAAHLPLAPAMFPAGELTDRGLQFRIAEMIREKLTLELIRNCRTASRWKSSRLAEEDGSWRWTRPSGSIAPGRSRS